MNCIKLFALESRCLLAANSTEVEKSSIFVDDGQWINGYNGVWNLVQHFAQLAPDTRAAKVAGLARSAGEILLMHPQHEAFEGTIEATEAKLAAGNLSAIQKVLAEEKVAGAQAGKFITDGWTTFDVFAIASTASTFFTNKIKPYVTGPLEILSPYLFAKSAWSASSNALEHWSTWVTACNAVVDNPQDSVSTAIDDFHNLVAKNQQPFFHSFLAGQAIGKTVATAAGPIMWTVGKLFSKSGPEPVKGVRALEGPQQEGPAPVVAPIPVAKHMSWNSMVMTLSAFTQVGTHWIGNYLNPETLLTDAERTTIKNFLSGLKNEATEGLYTQAFNQYAKDGSYVSSFIPHSHAKLLKKAGGTDDGVALFCSAFNIRGC